MFIFSVAKNKMFSVNCTSGILMITQTDVTINDSLLCSSSVIYAFPFMHVTQPQIKKYLGILFLILTSRFFFDNFFFLSAQEFYFTSPSSFSFVYLNHFSYGNFHLSQMSAQIRPLPALIPALIDKSFQYKHQTV